MAILSSTLGKTKYGDFGKTDIGNVSLLTQGRSKGILRKIGVLEDGRSSHPMDRNANGEVALYKRAIGKSNGIQFPVNFKMTFNPPAGINQPVLGMVTEASPPPSMFTSSSTRAHDRSENWIQSEPNSYVRGGSLDWQTHRMNASTTGTGEGSIFQKYENAAQVAYTMWDPNGMGIPDMHITNDKIRYPKEENILDLYCSKVSIPEKSIQFTSMRHYGTHFAYPQTVSYGQLQTTFYCDGSMHIKNFFDAWQKLIYNDQTGNFNYYDEYTSEFDIFTRTTLPVDGGFGRDGPLTRPAPEPPEKNFIQEGTAWLDDLTGVAKPPGKSEGRTTVVEFRNSYGVKVMQCWPQIVSAIDLGHASTQSIAEFNVTWVYKKWDTFNLGDVSKRGRINLPTGSVGEDTSGFPFIRDLPPELSGPMTDAVNQGLVTSPYNKFSQVL